MCRYVQHRLIALAILPFLFQLVKSQNVPAIPCPDIFQYLSYGDNYIGMVTLNNLPLQTTVVEVEFVQRESITTNYNGRLTLVDDLPTVQRKMESGKPIKYRIDFPNARVIPKLKSIRVNERTVCSGSGLDAPSTTFKLSRTFFPAPRTTAIRPSIATPDVSPPKNSDFPITVIDPDFKDLESFFNNPFLKQLPHGTVQNTPTPTPTPPQPKPQAQPQPQPIPPPTPIVTPRFNPPPITKPATQSPNLGCGREGLTPLVALGNDYPRGKFPWLVAVYIRDGANIKFQCGGSLISSRTVITAAHCFPSTNFPPDRIFVSLGRHNLFISEDGSQQLDIISVNIHPNYNTSVIPDADIALLHMSIPVSFTQYIRPICLWSQSSDISLIVDQKGYVAGWGSDNNGNDVSSKAKMVEARIVNETECLRSSDLFRYLTTSRSLCAGNRDGSGPCVGDSGGGLMLNVYGVWTLRGIVSVGPTWKRICDLGHFVVYCDVAKHISWIRQNMLD